MIKNNTGLIIGLNEFIRNTKSEQLLLSGVMLNTKSKADGDFDCRIGGIHYSLLFQDKRPGQPEKSFIYLYDGNKDKPSVVQFTIDSSNFKIDNDRFRLSQNRGITIGKKIVGFQDEFKSLMYKNGFNTENIIATGEVKKPNYLKIIEQILEWLKIQVKTKLQLEKKYRNIEDRANETDLDIDNFSDIESKTEGGKKVVISVKAERNSKLREQAIKIHGLKCKVCDFDFEKVYGSWGKGFIEVHHMIPLSDSKERETNPKTDLVVVCSNCHRMIHRKKNITLTIEELKAKL